MNFFKVILAAAILYGVYTYASSPTRTYERRLLQQVQSLTFEEGKMCANRRVSAMPQLVCIGSSLCGTMKEPKAISCLNLNNGKHRDPDWKCTAVLDRGIELGKTEVVCEGFDYPEDPYILENSCFIEYSLIQTTNNAYPTSSKETITTTTTIKDITPPKQTSNILEVLFLFVVVILIIWCIVMSTRDHNPTHVHVHGETPYVHATRPWYRRDNDWWSGYWAGSTYSQPRQTCQPRQPCQPSSTVTTTVIERSRSAANSNDYFSSTDGDSHVSTSTAGTRRR